MKYSFLISNPLPMASANKIVTTHVCLLGLLIAVSPLPTFAESNETTTSKIDDIRDAVVAQLRYLEDEEKQQTTQKHLAKLDNTQQNIASAELLEMNEKEVSIYRHMPIIKNTSFSSQQSPVPVLNVKNENLKVAMNYAAAITTQNTKKINDKVVTSTILAEKQDTKETHESSAHLADTKESTTTAAVVAEAKQDTTAPQNTKHEENTVLATQSKDATVGWIYLGRYNQQGWENPTLDVKAQLPEVAEEYKISTTSVNIRDALPKKDALGELQLGKLMKVVLNQQVIKVLQLKPSGKNNHYWAKILFR